MNYRELCLLLDGKDTTSTEAKLNKIIKIQQEIVTERYIGGKITREEWIERTLELEKIWN